MLEPTWTALKHHRRLQHIVATLVRFGAQDVLIRLGLGSLLAEVKAEPGESLPASTSCTVLKKPLLKISSWLVMSWRTPSATSTELRFSSITTTARPLR